jgi:lysyl-tRNA synthetase class II
MADEAAKQAAQTKGMNIINTKHKPLKSSRVNKIRQDIKNEWKRSWEQGNDNAKQLRRITKKNHVQMGKKLYNSITSRQQTTHLARLRTGHCSLNQYLHRFKIEESPLCQCNNGAIETVEHYLLHCPRYEKERVELMGKVGIGGMWIEKLLGYPDFIHHTLEFVKNTQRFNF